MNAVSWYWGCVCPPCPVPGYEGRAFSGRGEYTLDGFNKAMEWRVRGWPQPNPIVIDWSIPPYWTCGTWYIHYLH